LIGLFQVKANYDIVKATNLARRSREQQN
jgi:hypothetical protein